MAVLKQTLDQIHHELDLLNETWIDLHDTKLKASNCYRFETNPPHVLFNLNCPEELRNRLTSILSKYIEAK
jgi:hypothetical protein